MAIIVSVIIGIFGLIGWLSHLRFQRYQVNVKSRNERFNKVMDRFGDEKDLLQFLQSERGLQIVAALASSPASTKVPILVMISSGVVALAIGMGATALAAFVENDLIFGAIFMSATGLGLLAAAAISLLLSRKWGIFEENNLLDGMIANPQPDEQAEKLQ